MFSKFGKKKIGSRKRKITAVQSIQLSIPCCCLCSSGPRWIKLMSDARGDIFPDYQKVGQRDKRRRRRRRGMWVVGEWGRRTRRCGGEGGFWVDQTHIPEQLEPLQAPIKERLQFFGELANKRWEVGDKTQSHLPACRHQPPRTEGLPRGFPGALLLPMQESNTFQWPIQLQRIKFSSLSVIC